VSERRTGVAAYALCVDADGRILLCRASFPIRAAGVWTLPGGGLGFGEDPARGVIRELAEETGLEGRIARLESVSSRTFELDEAEGGGELHKVRILYRVEVTGGSLRDEVGGTTDRCAWLEPAEARRLRLDDLATMALDLVAAD
jgi:ADP-ribose pyrophosphatase YjhB (NUDIX family)